MASAPIPRGTLLLWDYSVQFADTDISMALYDAKGNILEERLITQEIVQMSVPTEIQNFRNAALLAIKYRSETPDISAAAKALGTDLSNISVA